MEEQDARVSYADWPKADMQTRPSSGAVQEAAEASSFERKGTRYLMKAAGGPPQGFRRIVL